MRGLAALAVVAALALATVTDLAQAKPKPKPHGQGHAYGHQQQKTVRPVKPAAPVTQQRAATPAPKPAEPRSAPARPQTSVKPQRSAPASPTVVDGCKADPGSCQERGRGNSGDIDPYRGPDAPGNNPSRGNDCDEGGGNNRTSYPRRTNPNNPGDSPVDNDRGRGNNRCTGASGGSDDQDTSSTRARSDQIVVLGVTRAGRVAAAQEVPADVEERYARKLAERRADPDQGGILGARAHFLPVDMPLPQTGEALLALVLTGSFLSLLGLGLRRRVGRLS